MIDHDVDHFQPLCVLQQCSTSTSSNIHDAICGVDWIAWYCTQSVWRLGRRLDAGEPSIARELFQLRFPEALKANQDAKGYMTLTNNYTINIVSHCEVVPETMGKPQGSHVLLDVYLGGM